MKGRLDSIVALVEESAKETEVAAGSSQGLSHRTYVERENKTCKFSAGRSGSPATTVSEPES